MTKNRYEEIGRIYNFDYQQQNNLAPHLQQQQM